MISNAQNKHHPSYRDLNSYEVEWRVKLGDTTLFASKDYLQAICARCHWSFLHPECKYQIVGTLVEKKS